MNEDSTRSSRRVFLKAAGLGALGLAGAGALAGPLSGRTGANASSLRAILAASPPYTDVEPDVRLAASDGFIWLPNLPNRARHPVTDEPALYMFGFRDVSDVVAPRIQKKVTTRAKGIIPHPAPILQVPQNEELVLRLHNVGFKWRPDLTDGHTIHWHGFRNAIALFDGVPEVSIGVPAQRVFPYVYRPRDPGTYMYHCHFEDVEHVQMGMVGVVFVTPTQNGTPYDGFTKFAYNDGDGTTGYDREFAMLLTEIDTRVHIGSLAVQEFVWTEYDPNYWLLNGRVYPHTAQRMGSQLDASDPLKGKQAISSLVQCEPSDRVLLRFVNLGYQQQAMQLPGIRMRVVGEDATLLRSPGGDDLTYETNTVYIGPGESRDVVFTAPAFDGSNTMVDTSVPPADREPYNRYFLRNHDYQRLNNNGEVDAASGLGGQATEVRVYAANTLPNQTAPNQTYEV